MKLFITEKEYYVYTHSINGRLFYIGKGKGMRCIDSNRSKYYDALLFKMGKSKQDVEVKILEWFDSERDALLFEKLWIRSAKEDNIELANILDNIYDNEQDAINNSYNLHKNVYCDYYTNKLREDFDMCVSEMNKDDNVKYYILEFIKKWCYENDNGMEFVMLKLNKRKRGYEFIKMNNFNIGKAMLNNILLNIGSNYSILSKKVSTGEGRITLWIVKERE